MEKLHLFYSILCWSLLTIVIGLTIPMTSLSQCDECIDKKVTLYDVTVNVPEPSYTDTIAYLRWLSLSNIGAFARTIIQEEDPSKDCLFFVDMGTRLMAIEDSSVYGVENITPAPAGPIKSTDYLLNSTITQINDNQYLFTVQLECGTSREVVKTSSSVYTAVNHPAAKVAAARQALAGLQPLAQTIQDFEIKKRDEDVKVARDFESEIIMTPEKDNLQVNDSVRIELELKDKCDNYPLQGREIILEAYTDPELGQVCSGPRGGTVSPTRVTTDENGKAWVTFKSGSSPGLGRVMAAYVCKKPHGLPFYIVGSARFNLPSNVWDIQIHWTQDVFTSSNVTSSEGGPTFRNTSKSFFHAQGHLTILYENTNPENQGADTLIVNAPDDSSAGNALLFGYFGTSQAVSVTRLETLDEDGTILGYYYANSMTTGITGEQSYPSLFFNKSGTSGFFGLGMSQHVTGNSHIKLSGIPEGGPTPVDDWLPLFSVLFTSFDREAQFRCENNNFEAKYNYSNTTTEDGHSSTLVINVDAIFINQSPPTGIKSITDLPTKFFLNQNYPNPFNPSTKITFGIPERSVVDLKIYNILGEEIATLINGEIMPAGSYTRIWNADKLPGGVYFYRLDTGSFVETKKLVLLK